jgi:glycosyltransferase involved in cell wall biosynthesis
MELDENKYDYDVVYVGRLTYPKNPQRLIDVFSLLCDRIPTAKVAIVGNGELEEETKQLAQEHNLMSNLSFLGFQSNPLKIMKDSKVMIMTSRWEGTPMCALEAMALGVPIVSTPTDGLRVLVKHGITGYLSDSDEELANYIVSLIENQQRQHDMSNMSLEVAKDINDKTEYKKAILQALNG